LLGQRVAAILRRSATSSCSGILTLNCRMAALSVATAVPVTASSATPEATTTADMTDWIFLFTLTPVMWTPFTR